jgi:hypothetical protein
MNPLFTQVWLLDPQQATEARGQNPLNEGLDKDLLHELHLEFLHQNKFAIDLLHAHERYRLAMEQANREGRTVEHHNIVILDRRHILGVNRNIEEVIRDQPNAEAVAAIWQGDMPSGRGIYLSLNNGRMHKIRLWSPHRDWATNPFLFPRADMTFTYRIPKFDPQQNQYSDVLLNIVQEADDVDEVFGEDNPINLNTNSDDEDDIFRDDAEGDNVPPQPIRDPDRPFLDSDESEVSDEDPREDDVRDWIALSDDEDEFNPMPKPKNKGKDPWQSARQYHRQFLFTGGESSSSYDPIWSKKGCAKTFVVQTAVRILQIEENHLKKVQSSTKEQDRITKHKKVGRENQEQKASQCSAG